MSLAASGSHHTGARGLYARQHMFPRPFATFSRSKAQRPRAPPLQCRIPGPEFLVARRDLIAEGDYVVGQWEGGGAHPVAKRTSPIRRRDRPRLRRHHTDPARLLRGA
jgi:hypothetical protein